MAKKSSDNFASKLGVWSYVAGMAIALIFSLITLTTGNGGLPGWAVVVLALLGIVVGLLNISADEVMLFLTASIAFVIASLAMGTVFANLGSGWHFLEVLMNAITVFTAPGALVVAFKALYQVAKND